MCKAAPRRSSGCRAGACGRSEVRWSWGASSSALALGSLPCWLPVPRGSSPLARTNKQRVQGRHSPTSSQDAIHQHYRIGSKRCSSLPKHCACWCKCHCVGTAQRLQSLQANWHRTWAAAAGRWAAKRVWPAWWARSGSLSHGRARRGAGACGRQSQRGSAPPAAPCQTCQSPVAQRTPSQHTPSFSHGQHTECHVQAVCMQRVVPGSSCAAPCWCHPPHVLQLSAPEPSSLRLGHGRQGRSWQPSLRSTAVWTQS